MPEYRQPGVYVEELRIRTPLIEGLPTAVAGFVGPARQGPIGVASPLLTGLIDFEHAYGKAEAMPGVTQTCQLWHSARAFFAEGGKRLHVVRVELATDGYLPGVQAYAEAFAALERVAGISLVAAPGSSQAREGAEIVAKLIAHAEACPNRFALVDSVPGQDVAAVQAFRSLYDSSRAALYYPWIRIADPSGINGFQPPSAFVAGIMARVDMNRAIWKAPANEVVNLAVGFERQINKRQQEVLNPEGVNCFRTFEGRGHRLWGGRTMSSDPEWKYVNIRRFVDWLRQSIVAGTRWASFEPNDERLWKDLRAGIEQFLLAQWRAGGLQGDRPEAAFFIKCDATTMTQADIVSGRAICQIGLAVVKPAEFVIVRIPIEAATRPLRLPDLGGLALPRK